MLKNYLKIALRSLRRHPGYAFINLFGLAVGMACGIVILLYVQDELRYDRFHHDADRIYRVVKDFVNDDGSRTPDATTPPALMPALLREIPEIEQATRVFPSWGFEPLLTYEDKAFYEGRFLRVDSTFFEVFTFPFVRGDAQSAFAKPHAIVLTETTARKYFGDEDPLGKSLNFNREDDLEVVGVLKDPPAESHFKFDLLIPIRTLNGGSYETDGIWGWYNFYTYVKLREETDLRAVTPKIQALFKRHQPENDNVFYAQPLAGLEGIHLNSHLKWELEPNSDRAYLYVFFTVALCVLVIAGVNYVNLTTAKSSLRAKEVGVRKVVGAARKTLIRQFLAESMLTAVLAAVLAVALSELVLPFFNAVTQKDLSLLHAGGAGIGWIIAGVTLLCGLAAGVYPAFYLSSFNPVAVLKGVRSRGRQTLRLRQGLVVFQFVISVMLLAGLLVIRQQMRYIQSARLGYDTDQVVVVRNASVLPGRGKQFREALLQLPGVDKVAFSDGMIGGQNWTNSLRVRGSDNGQLVNFLSVGYDFLDALGIPLKEGRSFSPDHPSDSLDAIILNETAVKNLGVPEPVLGQQIVWSEDADTTYYATVVGVVKDFHFTSLRSEIKPFAFVFTPQRTWEYVVKLSSPNVADTLSKVEGVWAAEAPGWPFDFYFLDESIDQLYRFEQNFHRVFSAMTLLGLLVACLGLFGLAAFTAEQRTKEIGIRKVLGATVPALVALLSKDFLKLVGLAFVLAAPLAYVAMHRWLEGFAYRIDLSWGIFLLAGLAALGVALLTVSYQAVRAALADPVKSLRYE